MWFGLRRRRSARFSGGTQPSRAGKQSGVGHEFDRTTEFTPLQGVLARDEAPFAVDSKGHTAPLKAAGAASTQEREHENHIRDD